MTAPNETREESHPVAPGWRAFWMRNACSPGLISLLLALVTLAVFWPVAKNDFVNYDDGAYVEKNPTVQAGLTWASVKWAFTTDYSCNWHPLTWLSHMLDCELFGLHATGHHLVNVLFHLVNVVLLFQLLFRTTRAFWQSALVAALFAWHPLRVESVAWVAERKDVLSAFFFLLTLWAYGRYAEFKIQNSKFKRRPMGWYSAALFFFALGLMSKPMLVTLPFVLLLLDYWPLGRVSGSEFRLSSGRKLLLEKLPFLALSVASSVITYRVQQGGGAVVIDLSPGGHIANALVSYVRYLGKMFWPLNLAVFYPHPVHWPVLTVLASALLLILVSAVALQQWRRRPYLAVGWFWYLGMLVPVIGLVQVGLQSMADRYTYLPMIGFWILLIWGAGDFFTSRAGRPVAVAAAMVWLAACAFLCRQQIRHWRNSGTLFEHAAQVTVGNYLAYNNLGNYQYAQGKLEEAMADYRKAIACNSAFEDPLNNLALVLYRQQKYPEAITYFKAALRARPDRVEVHHSLAEVLRETGVFEEAAEHYRFVLERQPDNAAAHNSLGTVLVKQGRLDEATAQFREAVRCATNAPTARLNLALALVDQHRFDQAIPEYLEYLRLKPDDFRAQKGLADLLTRQGRLEEAIGHYTEVVRSKADYAEAHCNLGMALARAGRLDEGAAQCREAVKLKPDLADARNNLGTILGMQGRIDEAESCFREAIRLDPDHADAHSNLGNALVVKSRFEEAMREYRESLRIRPDRAAIHVKLAEVLTVQGRWAEAAGHYREALRLDPQHLEARNGLEKILPRMLP
jgi:tetratricopeptide (TPR) repeat protein